MSQPSPLIVLVVVLAAWVAVVLAVAFAWSRVAGVRRHRPATPSIEGHPCPHAWQAVEEDLGEDGEVRRCKACGATILHLHLGDIGPGESRSIAFRLDR